MRTGQNPMKWRRDDFRPQPHTVCTIVHIPELTGFWEDSLEVLLLCLRSLRANTGLPFDLMVFDNASCQEVRDELTSLQKAGVVDYLVLSHHNTRKLGAVQHLLAAAPGDFVTITDSDVYFERGWLEATLNVFQAFPEAGQVTALPTADRIGQLCDRTLTAAREGKAGTLEEAPDLIPETYLRAHASSLGISWEEYEERAAGHPHVRVTRDGISAYVSAQDFQYTTTRQAIEKVMPLGEPGEHYYDAVYSPLFEAALDKAGLWRLSTSEYLAHHMGNKTPTREEMDRVFDGSAALLEPTARPDQPRKGRQVQQNRFVRRALKAVNSWTYRRLFG